MPLLLARIDDRLIHGQVVYGWGGPLRPSWIVIVSDALRHDPDRAALYLFAAPEGAGADVLSVAETLEPRIAERVDSERTFLLFPGPQEPLRLKEGGFSLMELNVGGLHHAEGKTAVLPYVYLDDADRAALVQLSRMGVRLIAQDLPGNPSLRLEPLLGEAA